MINPITAIKAFFTAKSAVQEISQEATKMDGTTPGWKTSEFWAHVVTQITTLWLAVQGLIPAKYAAIISVIGTAVYTICRTSYKVYTTVKTGVVTPAIDAQTVVVNK